MAFSSLGRLLDIEWMLWLDEARATPDVIAHDRELLRGRTPDDVEQALALWLDGRRRELSDRTLGVRVSETLTVLHAGLVALSLAAGAGTAEALLESASAREPTNVLHFLFATLVWPLALLLGSALALALRGRLGRSVLLTELYTRLLGAVSRVAASRAHEDWDLGHEWRRLRRAGRRYKDIEVATLASAAQWYPLAFHLGAAASLLGSALFSDLAFAWSTTTDSLTWDTLATFFRAITAPWCVPFGVGCVDPELVRATQFSRFTGQYALPHGAALSGAWWPALLACLLVYGVLPRLVFALGLAGFVKHRSARLSERVLELRARLRPQVDVITSRTHPGTDGAEPAPEVATLQLPERQPQRACWVIRWREAALDPAAEAALTEQLGLHAVRREAAGGSDFARDSALLLEASSHRSAALVLVVEGWEAPDKATRSFVQALRRSGDAERPIFVSVLLGTADAPELAVWRDRLRLLEDPFVSVEPCVRAANPGYVSTEELR
jgi:hypothetical protein